MMKVVTLVLTALVTAVLSLPRPQQGKSDEDVNINYEYGYEVLDKDSGTYYSHTETKMSNGDVFGSWAVLLPSNEIQTMVYNVTKGNGFRYSLTYTPVEVFGDLG